MITGGVAGSTPVAKNNMLIQFSDWLASTSLSLELRTPVWVVPLVQTIHILAIASVLSAVLMINLRILGLVMPGQTLAAQVKRYVPWIWYPLIVLLLSGALLVIAEPQRSVVNPYFQAKMIMLVVVVALTAMVSRPLASQPTYWEQNGQRQLQSRALAVVSFVLWLGIVFAGRWIAYSVGMGMNLEGAGL